MQDRDVRPVVAQRGMAGIDDQIDIGELCLEERKPRHQPHDGKRVGGGDPEFPCRAPMQQVIGDTDTLECIAQCLSDLTAGLGGHEAPVDAMYKRNAAPRFEFAQAMADGCRRHAQLLCSRRKRPVATHRLKDAKAGHGRSVTHPASFLLQVNIGWEQSQFLLFKSGFILMG